MRDNRWVIAIQDLIGTVAATLTTVSFVPQALKTFRTRDVSGISLGMYSCFTAGVALWLIYGFHLGEWPIIAANAITLGLASIILVTKVRHGHLAPATQPSSPNRESA